MRPKELSVIPDSWSMRGEATVHGPRPLHVWQGIPGEESLVRIVHHGQHRSAAVWLESEQPSPERVSPPCERYTLCGGCALMHLDQEAQGSFRRRWIEQCLAEEGLDQLKVSEYVPSAEESDYRHVLKLVAGYSDQGRPRLGVRGRVRGRLVTIPGCLAVTSELRALMSALAYHFIRLKIPPHEEEGAQGLRYIIARQSMSTGRILVTLVASRNLSAFREFAQAVESQCKNIEGIHIHLNSEPGNAIFSRDEQGVIRTKKITGNFLLSESLLGTRYRIGPGDFFQTHPRITEEIHERVRSVAKQSQSSFVDLYCGVGGFALSVASDTGWALGVESIHGAVERAKASAKAQGVNAEFLHGEVEELLPQLQARLRGRHPVVMMNPARRGLEEGVAEQVLRLAPSRLLYLSCNPKAMARDLAQFVAGGWKVQSMTAFEMFPHTPHVEVLVNLEAPEGSAQGGLRRPKRKRLAPKRSRT